MTALPSQLVSPGTLAQRLAGATLVSIALLLAVLDAVGAFLSSNACAILLFAVLATIAFAIHKTPGGLTSLIGLFFVGTILWVAPRPLIALVTGDDEMYTLLFGQMAAPRGEDLYHLLAFWTIGIASLYGGYFLFFSPTSLNLKPLSHQARLYCERSFAFAFIVVAILLPLLAEKRFVAFAEGGYYALYVNQAESSFSLLPLLGYLCPALFALAVILDQKKYSRLMVVAVTCYALCGILFGRRMEVGTWLLVALWHTSAIRGKPIRLGRLLIGFAAAGFAFQWIEMMRTDSDAIETIFLAFFTSQGVIFMIPALSWQLPVPPLHTILGSLLSIRHVYRLLGIGSIGTANILDYVSAQSGPALFESGNGLSSTGYLDIFFLSGGIILLYALGCGLVGFLLGRWEARSAQSRVALFLLCVSLQSIFFVQRSSIFTVTSQVVYLSFFMAFTYVLHRLLNLLRANEMHAEAVRDTHQPALGVLPCLSSDATAIQVATNV
jgi:hypothetical protein